MKPTEEEIADRMREVLQGKLARVAKARHPLVHVEGGPCVDSAPPGEKFLAPGLAATYDWKSGQVEQPPPAMGFGVQVWVLAPSAPAVIDKYGKITCPACHAATTITDGDLGSRGPSPFAAAVCVIHECFFGYEAGVSEYGTRCGQPTRAQESATFNPEVVTCRACLAKRGL